MSLTAQIGSSDVTFKLTQKVVASLAEKFSFKFEDGWSTISSRTIENIQKRLKREKRRANPTSSIKHPRTSFSFFTQRQRPISQAAHPTASFGDLSRFVSEAWKALTPEQMAEYKALETSDKVRYQTERDALLASAGSEPASASASALPVETSDVVVPVKAKKSSTPKAVAATVVEAVSSEKVKSAKSAKGDKGDKAVKSPKSAKAKTEVVAEPVVEEAKPVKAPKAKKAEAVVVAVVVPAETKAPKTPKAPKEVKAEVVAEVAEVKAPKSAKTPKVVKA